MAIRINNLHPLLPCRSSDANGGKESEGVNGRKNIKHMYTVDYFINKFEAIPEERIIAKKLNDGNGGHCANGWCGCRLEGLDISATDESKALQKLFDGTMVHYLDGSKLSDFTDWYSEKAAMINNGSCKEYQQLTPKQRILAALYDIKKMQSKDIDTGGKVKRIYVAVPVSITNQAKELVLS